MKIRPLQRDEVSVVHHILAATALFAEDEIDAAVEQARRCVLDGADSLYHLFLAEEDGSPLGFISVGPTPRHDGVYDLYWIAVSPSEQRRGIGAALIWFAEDWVRERGGRTILIETWAGDAFAPTRRFYERRGYVEESRVIDFRGVRHDKIILVKNL